jgi:predicted amidohydrolase YtcJ
MLIRNALVWGRGRADVRITDGTVTACAPSLRPVPGEDGLDARGGALLPGLHDHHVHLRALAAARVSVAAGPPHVRTAGQLADRLREAGRELGPGTWIRCVGYHESVAGPLDRWMLDRMLPDRPVRVQHRTGALWVLNSMAARQVALDGCDEGGVERDGAGRATGRLWRMDSWLAKRTSGPGPDLAAVSARAAACGVTGFTDATPGLSARDVAALAAAVSGRAVVQRVHCMAPPGVPAPAAGRFTLGPVKILLDDTALPGLDELAGQVGAAHAAGRPVAVHCVTRVQLILALAALDAAGRRAGDRIEHGAVIPAETFGQLDGLTVVTQPHFVAERGDQYAAEVAPDDLTSLWRLGSLLEAGIAVAAGTDAPFGGADPWPVIRAASRRPPGLGPGEAIPARRAIGLFLGRPEAPAVPRRIAPGQPADLTLLRVPPDEAERAPAADLVAATIVGGETVYRPGALLPEATGP